MKIVYILGNGFDLNLKLETSYASFLSYYLDKTKDVKDETIQKFREIIKEGKEEDWSDVELALGQCTSNFATFPNPTRDYEKCYASILENLVEYLKLVEAGMPEDTFGRECLEVFAKSLKNLAAGLKRTDQEEIKGILDNLSEGQSFSIITFNYTHIADYLMDVNEALEEADVHVMGQRIHRGTKYYNKLVKLIHVHGDISGDIIFGVDNESQIKDKSVIESDYFKKQILKLGADEYIGKAYDADANILLKNADVVYLYGVSLGETDLIWWERINKWLTDNPNCVLIMHSYELQDNEKKEILLSNREKKKDELKKKLLSFGSNSEETNERIMKQIYIDTTNIFAEFASVVGDKLDKYWSKKMTEDALTKLS